MCLAGTTAGAYACDDRQEAAAAEGIVVAGTVRVGTAIHSDGIVVTAGVVRFLGGWFGNPCLVVGARSN